MRRRQRSADLEAAIQGALENTVVEMGHKLMRMSYSSIIREFGGFRRRAGRPARPRPRRVGAVDAAAVGPDPRLHPRHAAPKVELGGDTIRPGDAIMHNDPVWRLEPRPRHRLHHAWCSTATASSASPRLPRTWSRHRRADAGQLRHRRRNRRTSAEGLAVQGHQGLRPRSASNEPVADPGRQQSARRTWWSATWRPRSLRRIGAERFLELIERYGIETVEAASRHAMDYAERLMRQAIAKVPDGVYRAETRLDGYLDDPDPARKELPIVVTLTVAGDQDHGRSDRHRAAGLDLADQHAARRHGRRPRCWLTIRSVLLDTAVHGHIPVNAGLIRPIKHRSRCAGSLANLIFPAPTIARLLHRQSARRHGDEGAGAGGSGAGLGRHR